MLMYPQQNHAARIIWTIKSYLLNLSDNNTFFNFPFMLFFNASSLNHHPYKLHLIISRPYFRSPSALL